MHVTTIRGSSAIQIRMCPENSGLLWCTALTVNHICGKCVRVRVCVCVLRRSGVRCQYIIHQLKGTPTLGRPLSARSPGRKPHIACHSVVLQHALCTSRPRIGFRDAMPR